MSQIKIDSDGLENIRSLMLQQEQRMQDINRAYQQIAGKLDMAVSVTADIQQTLAMLSKRSSQEQESYNKMAAFLAKVDNEFHQADRNVSQEAKSVNYLLENLVLIAKQTGTTLNLSPFKMISTLFGLTAGGVSTVPLVMSWLSTLLNPSSGTNSSGITSSGNTTTGNTSSTSTPLSGTIYDAAVDNSSPPQPESQYPFSKEDTANKRQVANLNSSYYADGYMKPNASGYKYQCTSYVYCRVREKYGLGALTGSNYGKDVAATFKNWTDGSSLVDTDGTRYRLTTGTEGNYKVKAFTGDGGSSITSDSWVSFSRSSNKAGHVVYVESVQIEDGVKYVYYSEGGTGFHNSGTDGVIKRLPFDKFLTQGDYTYTGCVTFEKA